MIAKKSPNGLQLDETRHLQSRARSGTQMNAPPSEFPHLAAGTPRTAGRIGADLTNPVRIIGFGSFVTSTRRTLGSRCNTPHPATRRVQQMMAPKWSHSHLAVSMWRSKGFIQGYYDRN